MPAGVQSWRADGSVSFDMSMSPARFIGVLQTGGALSGRFNLPGWGNSGRPWWYPVIISNAFGSGDYLPTFVPDADGLSWSSTHASSPNLAVYFGVY